MFFILVDYVQIIFYHYLHLIHTHWICYQRINLIRGIGLESTVSPESIRTPSCFDLCKGFEVTAASI